MPNQVTPQQKIEAAKRRNAAQRREAGYAPDPGEEVAPDDQREAVVRRVETSDRRPPQRPAQAQPGRYGGQPAAEPFKPYGTDELVVEYEGGEFLVTPWVLDDWDDVEAQAEGRGPKNEAEEIIGTIRALFDHDPARYQGLKQHIRDVHGYVSGNLMLGFIAEVRRVAEQGN